MKFEVPTLFPQISSPAMRILGILLLFYLLSYLVKFIFEKVISRLLKSTKTQTDDKILKTLNKPVFLSVFLIGIFVAANQLTLQESFMTVVENSIITALVFIWFFAGTKIANVVSYQLKNQLEHTGKHGDAIPFIKNILNFTLFGVFLLTSLNTWGIDITPILASAGVAGLAVAFAAKDTVANLFGGISVFFDKPYKVGDYVIVDDKYRGEVSQIGMRSTKIKTRDNVLLTVPNSVMVTKAVVNETGFDPKLRIRIPLGVSYDTDLEEVEKILVDELDKHPKVLNKPAPRVRYRKFGDSAIELEVLGTIETPPERGRTIHELIKKIHKRLTKEKIDIPYPHRVVRIKNEK